ncbi:MAG: phosphoribosyl-ATP diphosphatase [Oligosphaeraceae bacterium]
MTPQYLPPSPELWVNAPSPQDDSTPQGEELALGSPPSREEQEHTAAQLQELLQEAGLAATVTAVLPTTAYTRLEISLAPGTSLEDLERLRQEIQQRTGRPRPPRMLLPIPGRDRAGVEIPNLQPGFPTPQELFLEPDWTAAEGSLPLLLGKDAVRPIILDLGASGNLLLAGYDVPSLTSLLRQFLLSLISRQTPDQTRVLLFSTKAETFRPFAKLPHLLLAPQRETEAGIGLLEWCLQETTRRRRLLAASGKRNLEEYLEEAGSPEKSLPRIVLLADDLNALLTPRSTSRVQELLLALEQAGTVGVHLVAAIAGVVPEALRDAFPCRICGHLPPGGPAQELLGLPDAECLQDQGDFLLYADGETTRFETAILSPKLCARAAECAGGTALRPLPELQTFLHQFLEGRRALQEANLEKEMPQLNFAEPTANDALKCVLSSGQANPVLLSGLLGVSRERAENLLDELTFHEYLGAPDGAGERAIRREKIPPELLGEAPRVRKTLETLLEELSRKIADGDPNSRTVAEYNKGVHAIGKKIVEEAAEVWMAAEYENSENLSLEISQLVYHLLVLMLKKKITLEDIYRQL